MREIVKINGFDYDLTISNLCYFLRIYPTFIRSKDNGWNRRIFSNGMQGFHPIHSTHFIIHQNYIRFIPMISQKFH